MTINNTYIKNLNKGIDITFRSVDDIEKERSFSEPTIMNLIRDNGFIKATVDNCHENIISYSWKLEREVNTTDLFNTNVSETEVFKTKDNFFELKLSEGFETLKCAAFDILGERLVERTVLLK